MSWVRAVAICGAAMAVPSLASAQTTLTERLRVQGVYAYQTSDTPPEDLALQAVPELSLLSAGKRSLLRATYTLAATAHTTFPAEIANRVNLASTFELSKRTTLILSAEAGHTTIANVLLTQQPSDAPAGVLPLRAGQLVTSRVSEGTSWEASPVVRISQVVDASYITSFDAPVPFDTFLTGAVVSIDRTWKADVLGIDFRGGYAQSHASPSPVERLVPLGLTPHWRHDLSATLSSYVVAGTTVVISPDAGTDPLIAPFAQASLDYLYQDATFGLTAAVGTQANALTAQLLYAEQVTFRAISPLSSQYGIFGQAALGYTHGSIIERQRDVPQPPDFDTFIADASISWAASPVVEIFARYQFVDQITAQSAFVTTPTVQRSAIFLGIQLSSRPDTTRVPRRFPQRVDRSDGAFPP